MLQGILDFNGNICDFEKVYGVIFSRETATEAISNGFKSYHLIANEWVKAQVAPNKRIVSFLAGIDPVSNQGSFAILVVSILGNNFSGYEIWDINSNILATGSLSNDGLKYGGGPNNQSYSFIDTTYHDVKVTKDDVNHTLRIRGVKDISIIWGLFDVDLCDFDVTISLETLQPI